VSSPRATAVGQTAPRFRDRIVELIRVKGSELLANESNFRTHGAAQRDAMRGLLQEVGFVGALIARRLPDKSLQLIDGHMRADIAPEEMVPVLIVDLTDEEMLKVLATYDPVGALAAKDDAKLAELLKKVSTDNADVTRMLADLDPERGSVKPGDENMDLDDVPGGDPAMALQPHEHYDYLVVLATNTHEWNILCERLNLLPEKRYSRVGTCRAIKAERLLALLSESDASKLEHAAVAKDKAK